MEKMEKLLTVWMQDQHQSWVPLSLILIQKKAKSLYEDLKKKHGMTQRVQILMPAMVGFIGSRLELNFII